MWRPGMSFPEVESLRMLNDYGRLLSDYWCYSMSEIVVEWLISWMIKNIVAEWLKIVEWLCMLLYVWDCCWMIKCFMIKNVEEKEKKKEEDLSLSVAWSIRLEYRFCCHFSSPILLLNSLILCLSSSVLSSSFHHRNTWETVHIQFQSLSSHKSSSALL